MVSLKPDSLWRRQKQVMGCLEEANCLTLAKIPERPKVDNFCARNYDCKRSFKPYQSSVDSSHSVSRTHAPESNEVGQFPMHAPALNGLRSTKISSSLLFRLIRRWVFFLFAGLQLDF